MSFQKDVKTFCSLSKRLKKLRKRIAKAITFASPEEVAETVRKTKIYLYPSEAGIEPMTVKMLVTALEHGYGWLSPPVYSVCLRKFSPKFPLSRVIYTGGYDYLGGYMDGNVETVALYQLTQSVEFPVDLYRGIRPIAETTELIRILKGFDENLPCVLGNEYGFTEIIDVEHVREEGSVISYKVEGGQITGNELKNRPQRTFFVTSPIPPNGEKPEEVSSLEIEK